MSSLNQKLDSVMHRVARKPHIVLKADACDHCDVNDCLYFCPAACFEKDEEGRVQFHYEGCFECGTCRIMCPSSALEWDYPDGGFGVVFRRG